MADLQNSKDWTEILTAWLQVLALIAGGIFASIQYISQKQDVKVQRAVDYLSRGSTDAFFEARYKLKENELVSISKSSQFLRDKALTQDEINAQYYDYVSETLIKNSETPGLKPEFWRILGFLEEGVICAKQGVCDKETVKGSLSHLGLDFFHTYSPYLCALRETWSDPSIGKEAELFYNPTAAESTCAEYKNSREAVKLKAPAGAPQVHGSK